MKFLFFFLVSWLINLLVTAQIIAGPMLGQVELRDAKIWIELSPQVKSVQLLYTKKGSNNNTRISYNEDLGTQNYSRLSGSGPAKQRQLKVEFIGLKGSPIGGWSIHESQLKTP